jgi:heme-degrading monooxygenase HmoA
MQKVLIDVFIVPEESKADFGERTRSIQSFLKTLPGFVEGFVYEKKAGENRYNIITTAVWENEEAFGNARQAVAAEFQKQNFSPQEVMKKLKVEGERGVYERFPY